LILFSFFGYTKQTKQSLYNVVASDALYLSLIGPHSKQSEQLPGCIGLIANDEAD